MQAEISGNSGLPSTSFVSFLSFFPVSCHAFVNCPCSVFIGHVNRLINNNNNLEFSLPSQYSLRIAGPMWQQLEFRILPTQ